MAVRLITTRHNQRLYRAAWSILRNRADAEDAVQDAYIKAFATGAPFTGRFEPRHMADADRRQ